MKKSTESKRNPLKSQRISQKNWIENQFNQSREIKKTKSTKWEINEKFLAEAMPPLIVIHDDEKKAIPKIMNKWIQSKMNSKMKSSWKQFHYEINRSSRRKQYQKIEIKGNVQEAISLLISVATLSLVSMQCMLTNDPI